MILPFSSSTHYNNRKYFFNFYFFTLIILLLNIGNTYSQSISGSNPKNEPRFIVDMPTAGVLSKNTYSIGGNLYAGGGMSLSFTAGIFTNFNFGLSYASNNVIGDNNLEFQSLPGINLAYRLLDEELNSPALTFGINTQGKGVFLNSIDRFESKSAGVYIVSSKNFNSFLGENALHLGFNYSFEPKVSDNTINAYLGFEQTLGKYVSVNFEYNLLYNEPNNQVYKKNVGLLNTNIVVSPTPNFSFNFQIRDLLKARVNQTGLSRILALELINKF